ncbi:MAG: hypothetical protein ACTSRM_10980, partial [Alphaproteobacteria bacterium]
SAIEEQAVRLRRESRFDIDQAPKARGSATPRARLPNARKGLMQIEKNRCTRATVNPRYDQG